MFDSRGWLIDLFPFEQITCAFCPFHLGEFWGLMFTLFLPHLQLLLRDRVHDEDVRRQGFCLFHPSGVADNDLLVQII